MRGRERLSQRAKVPRGGVTKELRSVCNLREVMKNDNRCDGLMAT